MKQGTAGVDSRDQRPSTAPLADHTDPAPMQALGLDLYRVHDDSRKKVQDIKILVARNRSAVGRPGEPRFNAFRP